MNQIPAIEDEVRCQHLLIDVFEEKEKTTECHRMVKHGDLCWQHAKEDLQVEIKDSTIPNGGKGLFTTIPRKKNEKIIDYEGDLLTKEEYHKHLSSYAVSLPNGSVISAPKTTQGFARYINTRYQKDTERGVNVIFLTDNAYKNSLSKKKQKGYTVRPNTIVIVTKRKIKADEELL